MLVLKDYQNRVLDSLRHFFRESASSRNPAAAFQSALVRSQQQVRHYLPVLDPGLDPQMPYVCIRVPTGGGKTLLACHAAGIALRDFVREESGMVLWLVPSNTILDQTADALRDVRHPYRQALLAACGPVEIKTLEEALQLRRAEADGKTVVIVATIQSFRVENTDARKVYGANGCYPEFFQQLSPSLLAPLEMGPDGRPVPSLANVLRLRRPAVIVDEAHNARTDLSFSMLGKVSPACIVEFTATPATKKHPSNVLHSIRANELKIEHMIKLPLRVEQRIPAQRNELLADAVACRADLEKIAMLEGQHTREYIRPVMLIQAPSVADCEPLREQLVERFEISGEQVVISTGTLEELGKIKDFAKPSCPVRFVLTVEKLREGWDCPFAYVLCSLKATRSATAIEQIVGRILRLPGATPKRCAELNQGYVFSVSEDLPSVLHELTTALESHGFSKQEAQSAVVEIQQSSLFAQHRTVNLAPGELDAAAAAKQAEALEGKVTFNAEKNTIVIHVPLDEKETAAAASCVVTLEARGKIMQAAEEVRTVAESAGASHAAPASPYGRGVPFAVPRLCIREGQRLMEFEKTILLEHRWSLADKSADLPASYNPLERPLAQSGTVDVSKAGDVTADIREASGWPEDFVANLHQQVMDFGMQEEWSIPKLVAWLDREIEHADIPCGESSAFIHRAINGLMARCAMDSVDALALDRFRLRDQIRQRIQQHRDAERKMAFQSLLLPDSPLAVDESVVFDFLKAPYAPSWYCESAYVFKKHYFGSKPGELAEKTPSGALTEEFLCAQYLDNLDEVEFWARNLVGKPGSVRLQTSTDWFYPDFVCKLKDGRVAAIEYKGGDRISNEDSQIKLAVGSVWQSRSNGRCIFLMPSNRNFSLIKEAFTR
jgi:type III restriction enzyme